jgi:hypothetical protein
MDSNAAGLCSRAKSSQPVAARYVMLLWRPVAGDRFSSVADTLAVFLEIHYKSSGRQKLPQAL